MLSNGMGPYVDCDFFCLREIRVDEYMFGFEDNVTLNGAILNYPSDSEMAKFLVTQTQSEYFVPEHLSEAKKTCLRLRKAVRFPRSVEMMRWGTWGPLLVTYAVKKFGLESKAAAIDVFYPIHPHQSALLVDPGVELADLVTPRTVAVHLWHKMTKDLQLVENCPLDEIIHTGDT